MGPSVIHDRLLGMSSNGSASKTRMAVKAASGPHSSAFLGALIALGTIFKLHDLLGISVEDFAIAMGAVITVLSILAVKAKPWLSKLTMVALLCLPACNFTEGLAATSKTLRDLEPGFDRFAVRKK